MRKLHVYHQGCLVSGDFHVNLAVWEQSTVTEYHTNKRLRRTPYRKTPPIDNLTSLCNINHSVWVNCRNYFVMTYWTVVIFFSALHSACQLGSVELIGFAVSVLALVHDNLDKDVLFWQGFDIWIIMSWGRVGEWFLALFWKNLFFSLDMTTNIQLASLFPVKGLKKNLWYNLSNLWNLQKRPMVFGVQH